MADWSIKIVPLTGSGPKAEFVPQLQPGGPTGLNVSQGDSVSWNNTTSQTQQPWPATSTYQPQPDSQVGQRGGPNYLSDPIPPGHSSRPSWIVPKQPAGTVFPVTIYYISKPFPDVQGVITITN